MELDSKKGKLESDLNFFSQTSSSGSTSSQEKPLGVFAFPTISHFYCSKKKLL